jgi:hypothetical protein
VSNPLAILLTRTIAADGSDAPFGFVIDEIAKDSYKKQYPNASNTNWEDADGLHRRLERGERADPEYFYKVETTEKMHLMPDNTTVSGCGIPGEGAEACSRSESRDLPRPR